MEIESNELCEKLELYLSCIDLPDMDALSKSDPMVRVMVQIRGQDSKLVGVTESKSNDLNPVFNKSVVVDYFFEMHQTVRFLCVDSDKGEGVGEDLGTATCSMADILMADPSVGLRIPLVNKKKKTTAILVKYKKLGKVNMDFSFKVKCSKVKNLRWCGKSKPFLRIYKAGKGFENMENPESVIDEGWIIVHETEWPAGDLDPDYKPFVILGSVLNGGNLAINNKWELWDHSSDGNHKLIGGAFLTLNKLIEGTRMISALCKNKKFAGNIIIEDFQIKRKFPISDYIKIGLNLSLTVGVDFTASNGEPGNPTSLHNVGGPNPNQYQSALSEVGLIVLDYDKDKKIPVYGFGAIPPRQEVKSFCFPLNLDSNNPFVNGLQGVMDVYKSMVERVRFSGPTNFAPLISEAMNSVQRGYQSNKMTYSILLILTDGQITDFQETISVLVKCSVLPMSVIIIGVGAEDFGQMDKLDSDNRLLKDSQGNTAVRDIVQFVAFKKFASKPPLLSEAVLKELPRQINSFYQSIGVTPPS